MEPRGQIFTNGSAETPREMAVRTLRDVFFDHRELLEDFGNDDLDAAMASIEPEYICETCGKSRSTLEHDCPGPAAICPNCGESGGTPVPMGSGETSAVTGYQDSEMCCSLCAEDRVEWARRQRG